MGRRGSDARGQQAEAAAAAISGIATRLGFGCTISTLAKRPLSAARLSFLLGLILVSGWVFVGVVVSNGGVVLFVVVRACVFADVGGGMPPQMEFLMACTDGDVARLKGEILRLYPEPVLLPNCWCLFVG